MNIYHFFTSPAGLNTQTANAFGPMTPDQTNDYYNVNSLHTSNASEIAYAICSGQIVIQKVTNTTDVPTAPELVNVIVKPTQDEQTSVRFPQIKYIIYKGVLRDSIVDNSGNIPADIPTNTNDLTSRIKADQTNLSAARNIPYAPAPASVLAYDRIDPTPRYTNNDPIDHLFYDPDFALNIIHGGESFGLFYQGLFGIEIILESPNYTPLLSIVRKIGHIIPVALLNVSTATEEEIFENRNKREEVLHYMDPCAFFGAFYTSELNVFDVTTSSFVPRTGNEVYDIVLVKYLNKNKVYIDIRNEHNKAFNYYRNYADTIEIIGNAVDPNTDYYRSGWPILIWNNSDFIQGIPNFKNDIAIRLPKGDNTSPLVFVSQGFLAHPEVQFTSFEPQTNRIRFADYITPDAIDTLTQQFIIETPNYVPNNNVTTAISTYIRLRYYKRVKAAPGVNYVLTDTQKYDNVFLPLKMQAPFPVVSGVITKIFREEALIEDPNIDNGFFLASIGFAVDQTHVTYFLFPSVKKENGADTGADENVISITSESNTNEDYFIRLIEKRYRSETQNSILNTAGLLRFSPAHPTDFQILRFEDDSPDDLLFVPLSKDFFAVLIDKTTSHANMLIQAATLHADFDVRICLVNPDSYGPFDADARTYSSFELALRGYTAGSPAATEIHSTTTGNIEVFSHTDGLLYRDVSSTAITPASGIIDEDACEGFLRNDELGLLKLFIDELQIEAYSSVTPHIPSKILYDTIVTGSNSGAAPRRFDVIEAPPGTYTLMLPTDRSVLPAGPFAEFVFTFTIFKLTTQLDLAIAGSPMTPDGLQPKIFRDLKAVLTKPGRFQNPSTSIARLVFNSFLLDASIALNDRVDLLCYVIFRPPIPPPVFPDAQGLISYYLVFGSPDVRNAIPLSRVITLGVAEPYIRAIPFELNEAAQKLLKRDARCFYNYVFPDEPKPTFDMLGAGTGAGTLSILDRNNFGILFYNHVRGRNQVTVKTSNSASYSTFGGGAQTVVHIGSYGVSYTPYLNVPNPLIYDPSLVPIPIPGDRPNVRMNYNYLTIVDNNSNVIKFGSRLYQMPTDWPNQSVRWQPVQPLNGAFLTVDAKNIPGAALNTTFAQIGVTSTYLVLDATGNTIATFDFDKQDLIFTSRDRFNFSVQLDPRFGFMSSTVNDANGAITPRINNGSVNTFDEMAASVSVAKIVGPSLPIHIPGTFGDDRFELLNTTKDGLLVTAPEIQELDNITDAIIRGVPLYFNLQGNFIGYFDGPDDPNLTKSKVSSDGAYRLIEHDEVTSPLVTIPNAEKIKYSFASVSYNESGINFSVESYASPLVSRLDKRFLGQNLDGSGDPMADSFDYRSISFNQGRKLDLDLHTHYGQLPLTSRAHYTDIQNAIEFPSYNQVLTALRSFGVLETIFYRIVQRAVLRGIVNPQLSLLKSRLRDYIFVDVPDGPVAKTVKDVTTGELKFMTAEQYQFFKWYREQPEIALYDVSSMLT